MKITENCIVNDMPEEVYHNDPTPELEGFAESTSLSSTTLNALLESTEEEARLTINRFDPDRNKKKSDAMDLGSMAHDYILSGGESLYEIAPFDNWRTKDSQIVRDDIIARGKIPLNNSTMSLVDDLKKMKSRLMEQIKDHQDWAGIFDDGKPEQSLFAFDGEIWNRARVDWLVGNYTSPNGEVIENLVVDYKTTSLSFDRWIRNELWSGKYLQDPHYRRVTDLVLGNGKRNTRFIYVVQQTKEPYLVQVMEISSASRPDIEKRYEIGRQKFINCLKQGVWRGIPPYTAHVTPPPWIESSWEDDEINEEIMEKRKADKAKREAKQDLSMAG